MNAFEWAIRWNRILSMMVQMVGVGLVWAFAPAWLSVSIISLVALCVAVSTLASARLVRELRNGVDGDLMLQSGERLNRSTLHFVHRSEQVEGLVTLLLLGIALGTPIGTQSIPAMLMAILLVLPTGLVQIMLGRNRRMARRISSAHKALADRDFSRARQLSEELSGDRAIPANLRDVARTYSAEALLRMGRIEQATSLYEERWTGAIDLTALPVARLRMGAGDRSLAVTLVSEFEPQSPLEKHLNASLLAHLAVVEGRAADVEKILANAPPVTPQMQDERLLMLAVAKQALGEGDTARSLLTQLTKPMQGDEWLPAAYPVVWRLYDDARANRPTDMAAIGGLTRSPPLLASASAPGHAFAPPADDVPLAVQRRPGLHKGAAPLEWLPVTVRRRWVTPWIVIALSLVLLPLGGILLALGLLMVLVGTADPLLAGAPVIAVVAIGTGLTAGGGAIMELRARNEGGPIVLIEDERQFGRHGFRAVMWGHAGRLAVLCMILGLAAPTIELLARGTAWATPFALFAAGVMAWAGWVRWQSQRLVWLLHFDEPRAVEAYSERLTAGPHPHTRATGAILGMARLWQGDVDGAEAAWREVASDNARAWTLLAWLHVGRKTIDEARIFRVTAEQAPIGEQYRTAVLQGLVAVHSGQPAKVEAQRERWIALSAKLRNRFGGTLDLIVAALDCQANETKRGRNHLLDRGVRRSDYPWIEKVWPFLWAALDDPGLAKFGVLDA